MCATDRSGLRRTSVDEAASLPSQEPCPWTCTGIRSPGDWAAVARQGVVITTICLQNESVPNILVRDLPDDVHRALAHRAEHRGQSLQQYLSAALTRLAERPTAEELFDRVAKRRGGTVGLEQAVADLDAERSVS